MNPFVHLHVHTEYSLLDGACRIKDLVKRAAGLNMPALAITDHGVMYGAIEFYKAALDAGIKPIIGCEVYVAARSRHDRSGADRSSSHLTLLARDGVGYQNLMRLVTQAHLDGHYYKPRTDFELLGQYSEGLIALSACQKGCIAASILEGDRDGARRQASVLREIYGAENFYLELMDHGLPEQQTVIEGKIALSRELGIPVVATNDIHYTSPDDAELHDVLLCIQTVSTQRDPNRLRFNSQEFYLKSYDEMASVLGQYPEALENTLAVAERCNLELKLGTLRLPKFEVPEGHTLQSYLRYGCEQALGGRYGNPPPQQAIDRLNYELSVIEKCDYCGYFLIVGDFIAEAKSRGILVGPGRGSATGSIVTYLLGISEVDPLKYGLIFERMLNPERVSPPDIDLDFPDERREEIIDYVKQKYGQDHVAQVITFNTLGARAAIRDVGRVLEVPLETVDRVAKMIDPRAKGGIGECLETVPELAETVANDPMIANLVQTAKGLEGLSRHASVHAAAVVISDGALTDWVPLRGEKDGTITTQYSMNPVVDVGLVKMDFLGLKTLTVIEQTLLAVEREHGVKLDLLNLPLDDPATYDLLCRGDTAAVFQLESEGMRSLLRNLQPDNFRHVIALVALYRPGPMDSAPEFCNGRHGNEVRYLDPKLEPILKETYGVILYQEQVMQIASVIAGFTMPQAEVIMRAMAKKQAAKMEQMKPLFLQGCVDNGVPLESAQQVFERMETFSNYGFNKSHSTAYGLVAYWTAYLKANYPAEFMAAHITTVMSNSEDVGKYVTECRRIGLETRPPSVNSSQPGFSVQDGAVVFGLAAIKNFGHNSAAAIVAEREANGLYADLYDFCRRLAGAEAPKSAVKLLIQVGTFDEMGERNALLAALESAYTSGQKHREDQAVGQTSLFGGRGSPAPVATPPLPSAVPMSEQEAMQFEKDLLGLYLSNHPLLKHHEKVENCTSASVEELKHFEPGTCVAIAGVVRDCKPHSSRNGDAMMFCTLEGLAEQVEVTVFPRSYEECKAALVDGALVVMDGKIDRGRGNGSANGDGGVKFLCDSAIPLEHARKVSSRRLKQTKEGRKDDARPAEAASETPPGPRVHVELDSAAMAPQTLPSLKDSIARYCGNQEIVLHFLDNGGTRLVRLGSGFKVDIGSNFPIVANQLPGVISVWQEEKPSFLQAHQ